MKSLVWLLVLLNVGMLAYFNLDLIVPKPVLADRSIQAEKLKILSAKDLEVMPKKVAPTPEAGAQSVAATPVVQGPTICYKWGNFTKTNLPAAQVVLVRLGLESVVNQEAASQGDRRFWVYYPPLKNANLAQQKAAEIKALGVEELYIVQDSQWRNAISFGLFQDEQLAINLLNELQAKGVKGVAKALRTPGKSLSSLLIKSVTSEAALELHKIKPEFLGTDLVPAACP
ncbi:MAG: sporulation protein [Methylotenera sp.]